MSVEVIRREVVPFISVKYANINAYAHVVVGSRVRERLIDFLQDTYRGCTGNELSNDRVNVHMNTLKDHVGLDIASDISIVEKDASICYQVEPHYRALSIQCTLSTATHVMHIQGVLSSVVAKYLGSDWQGDVVVIYDIHKVTTKEVLDELGYDSRNVVTMFSSIPNILTTSDALTLKDGKLDFYTYSLALENFGRVLRHTVYRIRDKGDE